MTFLTERLATSDVTQEGESLVCLKLTWIDSRMQYTIFLLLLMSWDCRFKETYMVPLSCSTVFTTSTAEVIDLDTRCSHLKEYVSNMIHFPRNDKTEERYSAVWKKGNLFYSRVLFTRTPFSFNDVTTFEQTKNKMFLLFSRHLSSSCVTHALDIFIETVQDSWPYETLVVRLWINSIETTDVQDCSTNAFRITHFLRKRTISLPYTVCYKVISFYLMALFQRLLSEDLLLPKES